MAEPAGCVTEVPFKGLVDEKDTQIRVLNRDIAGKVVDYLIEIQSWNVGFFIVGHNLYMKVFDH